MVINLQNSKNILSIDTLGAQILSWQTKVGQNFKPVFFSSNNPKRSGMPIMFPFCGPLKDNKFEFSNLEIPQHGFARIVDWTIKYSDENKVILVFNYMDLSDYYKLAYPFQFELNFVVELVDSGIKTTLEVHNWDTRSMPVCPGFHPYFFVEADDKDKLQISNTRFKAKILPWSTGVDAQFFQNPKEFIIQSESFNLECHDLSNLSGESIICDLLTVWAGEVADFVCIEPMSKRFNSINTDPILIPTEQTYSLSYNWQTV
jgi:galactose mutarotase-like enzyme